jgi:hypothetical protein
VVAKNCINSHPCNRQSIEDGSYHQQIPDLSSSILEDTTSFSFVVFKKKTNTQDLWTSSSLFMFLS